jgi:hypothetical protein
MNIKKKFILNDAIDGTKLLLLNNQSIRALDSLGNVVEIAKLDSSDNFVFLTLPKTSIDPTSPEDLTRKTYVDTEINRIAYYYAIVL